jgi:hypothetical protein
MTTNRALPDQLVLRLDERSLRGFAKLHRGAGELRVFVPYTSPELTKPALAHAAVLTKNLSAHITLFAVQVVPFPLPLDRPDVSPKFIERRLAATVRDAVVQAEIRIGFARDRDLGCEEILPPNSLVVMATKKRWWPTAETKLARALARAGHSVALLGV